MKNVLFVCVENSCRSQMAEAFGNMYGQEIIKSYSCGSSPSGVINALAITSMRELDYDLSVHVSKGLQDIPDIDYDPVITMGCGDDCPAIKASARQDWEIPDPGALGKEEFITIRNLIAVRVKTLIEGF